MDYKTKPPRGNRVIVKRIKPFQVTKTKGGIHLPDWVPSSDDPMAAVVKMQTMEFVEVLAVGEGRADPATGKYTNGSTIRVGSIYLMRSGVASQNHMDTLPGRPEEFVVLEDTLVVEVELVAEEADPAPVERGERPTLVAVP